MRKEIKDILDQEVVTGTEARRLFGVDESSLRHKVARGTLEAVKKGHDWLYDRQDIEKSEE